jgi:hypothetical protein
MEIRQSVDFEQCSQQFSKLFSKLFSTDSVSIQFVDSAELINSIRPSQIELIEFSTLINSGRVLVLR